jgi:hypothetical protein
VIPSVGRFAPTAADARRARRGAGDHSTRTDRKVATVATAAVTDALRRTFLRGGPGAGVGLRGGTFTDDLNAEQTALVETLNGVRFSRDVAVTGVSNYVFDGESIDATISVDGPAGEDGTLHVSGVWFGTSHAATVLEVEGTLGSRSVALRVPAS